MQHFDVYVAGLEVPEDRAVRGLVQVFGMTEAAAQTFVRSLPRMGKRNQPADAAESYVRALRAIGIVVQTHACVAAPSAPPPSTVSRPPPRTSLPPPAAHLSEIARQWGIDLSAPIIPRAGNVPAELRAMAEQGPPTSSPPQHAAPKPGVAQTALPEWVLADPVETARRATTSTPAPVSSRPLEGPLVPGTLDLARPAISDVLPVHDSVRSIPSKWPPRSDHVGRVVHSVPPSSSVRPAPAPAGRTKKLALIAAGVIATVSLGVGYRNGWFETEAGRLAASFEREGIDAGRYMEADPFLEQSGARVEGPSQEALLSLLDGLKRAGALHVWVIGIEGQAGAQVGHGLLVELPTDPSARETIYFQHVRAAAPQTPEPRDRQRYLRIDL